LFYLEATIISNINGIIDNECNRTGRERYSYIEQSVAGKGECGCNRLELAPNDCEHSPATGKGINAQRNSLFNTIYHHEKVQQVHAPGDVLESLLAAHRSQREVVFQLRSGGGGLSAVAGSEQVEKQKIVLGDICEHIGNAYIELVEVTYSSSFFPFFIVISEMYTQLVLEVVFE